MSILGDPPTQHPRYQLDRDFYEDLLAAKPNFRLVDKFLVPAYEGKGFKIASGQSFRVTQVEGPQIADVAFWNMHNPKETYRSLRTWAVEGWFLKRFTRMWSNPPWFRPMATCIDETVDFKGRADDFHHHTVASHCSPETVEMVYGEAGLNACRLNLLQGAETFGLTEQDIGDNLDVFEKFRIDPKTGLYYGSKNDSKKGDYIEFYAEMDLLISVCTCPAGDFSALDEPYGAAPFRPVGIEIYDTGIKPKAFPAWTKYASD